MSTPHPVKERPVDALLARYAAGRRDPANRRIHLACTPVIMLSLTGILWSLHPLVAVAGWGGALWRADRLSRPLMRGLLAAGLVMLALLALMPALTVLPLSIAALFMAWSAQFIGNKMGGNTASFRTELRLLPVAPLYVASRLYRRLNIAW
jgi:uncharacterized membrane protein YGL010W